MEELFVYYFVTLDLLYLVHEKATKLKKAAQTLYHALIYWQALTTANHTYL